MGGTVTLYPTLLRSPTTRKKLLSAELIQTALDRCQIHPNISEADLRRATSDLYYAMFHAISEALVEHISGADMNNAIRDVYATLYRLPEHKQISQKCREITEHDFSKELSDFAALFPSLQKKRYDADYNPRTRFERSNVLKDIQLTQDAISGFRSARPQERMRFAYFLCLRSIRN